MTLHYYFFFQGVCIKHRKMMLQSHIISVYWCPSRLFHGYSLFTLLAVVILPFKCQMLTCFNDFHHNYKKSSVQHPRSLPLCPVPSRSSNRKGNTLAQGTSSLWMSRPKRKGWGGRLRPSRGWQVGEENSIPPCSLLPRKLLVNVTLPRSSTNFPVRRRKTT